MSEIFHVKLADDGRMVIPAPLRHRLGLHPGDALVIEAEETSLRVRSQADVLKEAQSYFRQFVAPGISVVDELLAERRTAAAQEEAELSSFLKAHGRGGRD
jgi:AbrB family looped-hinge helix DNA binding protein